MKWTRLPGPQLTWPGQGQDRTTNPSSALQISTVLCLVAQSCPTLCDPMDCSLPGSSVHGDSPGKNTGVGCHALLQGIFPPRDWTQASSITGRFFTNWAIREAQEHCSGWLIPSPGDLSKPGIEPGIPSLQAGSLPAELPGKPHISTGSTQILFWKLPLKFNQWVVKLM